jgi:hypothetical protein
MAISPNDFSLWARLTGNKYPSTPRERAQKGPEVRNFIQNLDKEGMLGGKQEEQKKKEKGLPEKLATGALIAGGIAAGVAAARDPRVQNVAQRAGSATKDKIKDFLVNFSEPRDVDIDIVNASGDVTPDPRQQQTNVAPAQLVGAETYKPAVEGKTFGTSGAVSKLEDIGDAELRARRTYSPMIDAIQQKNPGINVENMQRTMLAKAEKDRDYDIAYMVARGQGKTDETATQIARATAGFPTDSPVGKPTPYREFLGEQRTSSIRKETIDNLLNLVETGPQIILPEKAQNQVDGSSAIVLAGGGNNTNVIPTMGATIGGSSLTDKHATKMAVDNALDIARDNYEKTVSTIVEAGQTKGGSISTAAKAEQFLQKMRPTVVKELDKAIQEDLTKTTGLNPEDAAFAADRSLNPVSGFVERNPDQSIAKKDLREEKIAKIGEFVKPASNTGLRGTTGRPGIGLYGTPTETRKPGSESQPFGKGGVEVTKVTMQEGEGVPGRPDLGGRTETVPNVFDAGKTDPKKRTPEGLIYTEEALKKPTDMGGKQGFSSQPSTANPVESMQVADELRKIQTDQNISPEERRSKAKDFLKQKMAEKGISAMGQSEPLRKR